MDLKTFVTLCGCKLHRCDPDAFGGSWGYSIGEHHRISGYETEAGACQGFLEDCCTPAVAHALAGLLRPQPIPPRVDLALSYLGGTEERRIRDYINELQVAARSHE